MVTHQVRQVLDQLLRDAAQRRLDPTLGTYGGIVAECKCLPWIGADGRLIARNIFPDVRLLRTRAVIQALDNRDPALLCPKQNIEQP